MANPNPHLDDALAEAYASCPDDVVILHTLELRHPAFIDADGNPAPIRVVRNHEDLLAYLEAGAVVPAIPTGSAVNFVAFAFDFTLPNIEEGPNPELVIKMDNVSQDIVKSIELTIGNPVKIEVTYRPYLSNAPLDGPQMNPPMTFVIKTIIVDAFTVTASCGFADLINRKFPFDEYTVARFPGLSV